MPEEQKWEECCDLHRTIVLHADPGSGNASFLKVRPCARRSLSPRRSSRRPRSIASATIGRASVHAPARSCSLRLRASLVTLRRGPHGRGAMQHWNEFAPISRRRWAPIRSFAMLHEQLGAQGGMRPELDVRSIRSKVSIRTGSRRNSTSSTARRAASGYRARSSPRFARRSARSPPTTSRSSRWRRRAPCPGASPTPRHHNRQAGRLAGFLLGRLLGTSAPRKVAMFAGSLSYRGHQEREMAISRS